MEQVNFHVQDDFKFKIGREGKEITVPRLLFRETKKILDAVAGILVNDSQATLKILRGAEKVKTVKHTKAFNTFLKAVGVILPKLIVEKNIDKISELIRAVSNDVITQKDIEMMQYEEACKILSYLIEKNFESLKNLSASLQAIITSVRPETE